MSDKLKEKLCSYSALFESTVVVMRVILGSTWGANKLATDSHVFLPGCSFFNTTPSIMSETEQAESDSSLYGKTNEILHC